MFLIVSLAPGDAAAYCTKIVRGGWPTPGEVVDRGARPVAEVWMPTASSEQPSVEPRMLVCRMGAIAGHAGSSIVAGLQRDRRYPGAKRIVRLAEPLDQPGPYEMRVSYPRPSGSTCANSKTWVGGGGGGVRSMSPWPGWDACAPISGTSDDGTCVASWSFQIGPASHEPGPDPVQPPGLLVKDMADLFDPQGEVIDTSCEEMTGDGTGQMLLAAYLPTVSLSAAQGTVVLAFEWDGAKKGALLSVSAIWPFAGADDGQWWQMLQPGDGDGGCFRFEVIDGYGGEWSSSACSVVADAGESLDAAPADGSARDALTRDAQDHGEAPCGSGDCPVGTPGCGCAVRSRGAEPDVSSHAAPALLIAATLRLRRHSRRTSAARRPTCG